MTRLLAYLFYIGVVLALIFVPFLIGSWFESILHLQGVQP